MIGHGPHLAQPFEVVDGMPVFYSLGNFVFGTPGRYSVNAPGISVLLRTELTATGFGMARLDCLLTDNRRVDFRPRPCERDEAARGLGEIYPAIEQSEEFGSRLLLAGSDARR